MPHKKPVVVVSRKLPDAIETRMMELFDTRLNVDDHPMSKAELIEALTWAYSDISKLEDRNDNQRALITRLQDDIISRYPNMPSGWWLGVALFAAILIPWVLFGIWVVG